MLRRQDIADNVIEIDYINKLTPPFQRQETEENGNDTDESEESHEDESNGNDEDNDSHDTESESKEIEEDNAAEESTEDNANGNNKSSKQDSGLKDDDDSDYSDEPPGGGDGQGGGILGLLAGLSGGVSTILLFDSQLQFEVFKTLLTQITSYI